MNDTVPAPQSTRATVLLLAVAGFFSGAAVRICDPLLPALAREFTVTQGTAGRVVISFAIGYALTQLLFGPVGDRFGKARVMCVALFGCGAGAGLCALASGFDALVGLRIVWGMSAAGVIPLAMAWIGDTVPYEQRLPTLARLLTGTLSGMMAGQLIGGLFADSGLGWRGAFATLMVGYLAVAVLLVLHLRRHPSLSDSTTRKAGSIRSMAHGIGQVLRLPWSRVVLIAVAVEGAFLLGPLAFIPSYLHQRYSLSLSAAAALVSLYAAGGLVYTMTARRVVARLGERRMALVGGIVMGAGYLAWWLLPSGAAAGAVALAIGYGTYLYHNTLQTHATQMAPAMRGTAMSLFAFCLFGGQAAGVTISGYVIDHFGLRHRSFRLSGGAHRFGHRAADGGLGIRAGAAVARAGVMA